MFKFLFSADLQILLTCSLKLRETYLGPCRTSMMKPFCKMNYQLKEVPSYMFDRVLNTSRLSFLKVLFPTVV